MCGDKSARMIIKTGSGVPTIPVSADHRNGDWLVTDIYEGEQYLDTDTNAVYTRNGSLIQPLNIPTEQTVLKFRIHQTGTSAPVVIPYYNPNGFTLTTSYDAVGIYRVLGLTGELLADNTEKYEIEVSKGYLLSGSSIEFFPSTDESISINTRDNTGVNANDIMYETDFGGNANWTIVTIKKYS